MGKETFKDFQGKISRKTDEVPPKSVIELLFWANHCIKMVSIGVKTLFL
jgi:hypothetical protein